jgi:hypothetical protein
MFSCYGLDGVLYWTPAGRVDEQWVQWVEVCLADVRIPGASPLPSETESAPSPPKTAGKKPPISDDAHREAIEPKFTAKDEHDATNALAALFKENPDLTREPARDWLNNNGFVLSERGFDRVWKDARVQVGLERRAPPGRRSAVPKSSC